MVSTPKPITSSSSSGTTFSGKTEAKIDAVTGKFTDRLKPNDSFVEAVTSNSTSTGASARDVAIALPGQEDKNVSEGKEPDGKGRIKAMLEMVAAAFGMNQAQKEHTAAAVEAAGAGGAVVPKEQVIDSASKVTGVDIAKLDPKILELARSERSVITAAGANMATNHDMQFAGVAAPKTPEAAGAITA